MKRRTGSVRLWAAAFWLLVWEGASLALASTTGGRMLLLASPVQALGRLLALAGTAAFWQAVAFSSLRILGGFLLACALAAVLAPLAARFQWIRDLLSPLVAVVKAVPVVSFIILALIWRWTGYNMVFYLAGLQNIDDSVYEASYIDGATPFQQFMKITIPLLKPTILLTAIMSTSGTLQLFDESVNLTSGGPGKSTMTLAHYVYNISFVETPKFNYAAAISVFILVSVAVLSAIQMKVGDKRD